MTLHTRVAIVQEIDPQDAICVAAGEADRIATAKVYEPTQYGDAMHVGTVLGQGLPGIVDCNYRVGAPLHAEDYYGDDDDYEPGEKRWLDTPACWLSIGWDTAYGYTGPNGMGCSDLHSVAITLVHKALSERGIEMHWYNEYDAAWHPGIENLGTLSAAGLEADLWFRNTALPAIAADIALGGEK